MRERKQPALEQAVGKLCPQGRAWFSKSKKVRGRIREEVGDLGFLLMVG